jgi:Fe-S-cluster containining protein
MAEPGDAPWWKEGLRFRCTACGACCTGAPGHVWVEDADVERMAQAKGLTVRQFRKRFARKVGKRWSLRERENGDCVLLEGKRCSVYSSKPARCSTFPFWPEVLASPAEWADTANRCEGIGQGDLYPAADVERLLAGDARPLLERQARPEGAGDLPPEPRWEEALEALEALYQELDRELPSWGFTCAASGACCDFDVYGHRLYVTTLEAERFFRLAPPRQNEDPRLCPAYGKDRLCKARAGRMLGCRTYFCGPYPNGVPEDLHERYFTRLKALHVAFAIPYAYRDIVAWAAERSPAAAGPRPST